MNYPNLSSPVVTHTINTVYDEHGNVILKLGMHVYTVTLGDGSTQTYKNSENIQLCDGHVWNGAQGAQGLFVGVCEDCRRSHFSWSELKMQPASHGLCLARNLKRCLCGRPICGKHRVLGGDGHWRCLSCHETFRAQRAIRWLLFRNV